MRRIDDLLAGAALVGLAPCTPAPLDAAEDRLRASLTNKYTPAPPPPPPSTSMSEAEQDLTTLCETMVSVTGLDCLKEFPDGAAIPGPAGARLLGCALQLTGRGDSARFWWQYAAGAEDIPSLYCLYLHHLTLNEAQVASWWRHQLADTSTFPKTESAPPPPRSALQRVAERFFEAGSDRSPSTMLRVLHALKAATARAMPAPVAAVLDYVPVAVSHVDCLDLPLPVPGFDRHVRNLDADESARAPTADTVDGSALEVRTPAPSEELTARRNWPSGCQLAFSQDGRGGFFNAFQGPSLA